MTPEGGTVTGYTNLRCPETKLSLRELSRADAEAVAGTLHSRDGSPYADATTVLLRSDDAAAYPVVSGVPILMAPEVMATRIPHPDLRDRRWAEAYDEMEFYNQAADDFSGDLAANTREVFSLGRPLDASWVDSGYDAAAQLEAFENIAPIEGKVVLQLGGKGGKAIKFLHGGAKEAWLVAPMLSEVLYARELAERVGVEDRFTGVVAVAEQLPFPAETVDAMYAGGCLHHMATEYAAPEIKRVLASGGAFSAVEPWKTTLHTVGTRLIGKREANAYCRPLTLERLEPLRQEFDTVQFRHHGPFLRYVALALAKVTKREISGRTGLRLGKVDDRLPLPKRLGGSIAVLVKRD